MAHRLNGYGLVFRASLATVVWFGLVLISSAPSSRAEENWAAASQIDDGAQAQVQQVALVVRGQLVQAVRPQQHLPARLSAGGRCIAS